MSLRLYILNGRRPIECGSTIEWAMWLEAAKRHVGLEVRGKIKVSTVFLGLDCSFGDGPPLLFETMIFGEETLEGYQARCSTWDEAVEMHKEACKLAFKEEPL